MSTLGDMKEEIVSILRRTGYDQYAVDAVRHVIGDLQSELYFFNETHSLSFDTVIDQVYYDEDDDLDIPLVNTFQALHARVSGNDIPLRRIRTIDEFEGLNDPNTSGGQPIGFIYHGGQLGIYPPPNGIYTITLMGGFDAAAPVDEDEEDNVWMDPRKGYKLVMYAALEWLNRVRIRDYELANNMRGMMEEQKLILAKRTGRLKATNRLKATSW